MEQITLQQYMEGRKNLDTGGCQCCICKNCLYWWSSLCPYGECYDDYRAKNEPYNKMHPEKPLRTGWSDWNKAGEQEHWCRGGVFYPQYYCHHFVKYEGQQARDCLDAVVSVFQDGYIQCSLVDEVGCEECYRRFELSRIKNELESS